MLGPILGAVYRFPNNEIVNSQVTLASSKILFCFLQQMIEYIHKFCLL